VIKKNSPRDDFKDKQFTDLNFAGWPRREAIPHNDIQRLQFVTFGLFDFVSNQMAKDRNILPNIGCCILANYQCSKIVADALKLFDGKRYRLITWVIMPNHIHVLILPKVSLSSIVHSWKSFTAHQINKLLNRKGSVWRDDYFDMFIRDERHFYYVKNYIEMNPVRAGLVKDKKDWCWSGIYEGD